MRRIKVFLALVAVMVPMLIAFAGPAMADDLSCRDGCDHRFFVPFNSCDDFFFNCGVPFEGGIFFGINQEIENTGDVTLNTTVS